MAVTTLVMVLVLVLVLVFVPERLRAAAAVVAMAVAMATCRQGDADVVGDEGRDGSTANGESERTGDSCDAPARGTTTAAASDGQSHTQREGVVRRGG